MSVERECQIVADTDADIAVIAVARNIDEDRYEAVELVAAGKHADARTLLEREDGHREVEKRVFVDLEKLVARKEFKDVDQSLAGVAVRIEAGPPEDVGNL